MCFAALNGAAEASGGPTFNGDQCLGVLSIDPTAGTTMTARKQMHPKCLQLLVRQKHLSCPANEPPCCTASGLGTPRLRGPNHSSSDNRKIKVERQTELLSCTPTTTSSMRTSPPPPCPLLYLTLHCPLPLSQARHYTRVSGWTVEHATGHACVRRTTAARRGGAETSAEAQGGVRRSFATPAREAHSPAHPPSLQCTALLVVRHRARQTAQ